MKKLPIILIILIGLMSFSVAYAQGVQSAQEVHLAAEDYQLLTEADRPVAAGTQVLRDDATGGDCSSIGTWDSANKVCTLNTDVADSFLILDPLTLDCNGREISNPGLLVTGVTVPRDVDGVTIQNCKITGFTFSVLLDGFGGLESDNNLVTGNTIRAAGTFFPALGVVSFGGSNNVVTSNDVDVAFFGMVSTGGAFNVWENNLIGPTTIRGIQPQFNFQSTVNNNVINSNLPGSRGILEFAGNSNTLSSNTISDAGFFDIQLIFSNQDSVIGNTLTGAFFDGVDLLGSNNNLIADNDVTVGVFFGIELDDGSNGNTVTRNKIRRTFVSTPGNFGGGIFVFRANNNLVTSNDIDVTGEGVLVDFNSNGNTISDNKITSVDRGITLGIRPVSLDNNDNIFLNNVINSGGDGIIIQHGERNRAEGNTIRMGGGAGIVVDRSTDAEVVKNEVHKKAGDGLVILSSPTTQVTLNDIWLNGGFAVSSDTPIELSVNAVGNWWHGNCGKGLFVEGEDSNMVGVVDSNPFNHAVAHIPDPNEPKSCPN